MLDFNLLPVKEKEKIEKEKLYFLIMGVFKVFFLSLLTIFAFLLAAYFSLLFLSSSQEESFEEIKKQKIVKDIMEFDSQISKSNKVIDSVYEAQNSLVYLAPVIERVTLLMPKKGIYLTEILIEKKGSCGSSSEGDEGNSQEESENSSSEEGSSEGSNNQAEEDSAGGDASSEEVESTQKVQYEVKILGVAQKREYVIELQQRLEEQADFVGLVSPLQNILKAEDVEFEFTFRIKKQTNK